ncbi:hypothetical protein TNCV_2464521 [Trichonephila clavipes]|nr:hypothetical protein TNCV_2464521 [Trichonephila clavipes]
MLQNLLIIAQGPRSSRSLKTSQCGRNCSTNDRCDYRYQRVEVDLRFRLVTTALQLTYTEKPLDDWLQVFEQLFGFFGTVSTIVKGHNNEFRRTNYICDKLSYFNSSDSPSALRALHTSSGSHRNMSSLKTNRTNALNTFHQHLQM